MIGHSMTLSRIQLCITGSTNLRANAVSCFAGSVIIHDFVRAISIRHLSALQFGSHSQGLGASQNSSLISQLKRTGQGLAIQIESKRLCNIDDISQFDCSIQLHFAVVLHSSNSFW